MSEYLISFFSELGKLTNIREGDLPHGITCEQGTPTVLVSMGDLRARVPVTEFSPDPGRAARDMFELLRFSISSSTKAVLEGCRG